MNILNLPAPTAGAEFGQALGQLLGQGAGVGLNVYTRNKAMDFLDQNFPKTEIIEGTNVKGSQFYNQADIEKGQREAPFWMRGQVRQLMEERNRSSGIEIENANIYKNLASDILKEQFLGADPQTQQLFGDEAIKMFYNRIPINQAKTLLTQKAKILQDSGQGIENLPNVTFNPLKRLYRTVTGVDIPQEQIIETGAALAKPFVELKNFNGARRLLEPKNLPSVDTEKMLGYRINPAVTNYLSDNLKKTKPETLGNLIEEVFKIDPNTNLILLREKFVNTGKVNFADFLDAVSKLQNEQKIKLEGDQISQLAIAQKPEKDIVRKVKEAIVTIKPSKLMVGVGSTFGGRR
jgi:hypothetical protein